MVVAEPPKDASELLLRLEQEWQRRLPLIDRLSWSEDSEAARLLADALRSGTFDEEEWKSRLERIAYLAPEEAEPCLRRARGEAAGDTPMPGVGTIQPLFDPETMRQLEERAARGRRARLLADGPEEERRRELERLRSLRPGREHLGEVRVAILAEAAVDPHTAARICDELWRGGELRDPLAACEVVRRLWISSPDAALVFLDRYPDALSHLPILLRRALATPGPENHRLALELIRRVPHCSPGPGRLALMDVVAALHAWLGPNRNELAEAVALAFRCLIASGGPLVPAMGHRLRQAAQSGEPRS